MISCSVSSRIGAWGRVSAAVAVGLLALAATATAGFAQSLIQELKIGALYHDPPDLWSGFRMEKEGVDINLEALLRPSIPFLLGQLQPAVGGTISTRGDTSHAYIDARWQYEFRGGIFVGIGAGAAIHDGHVGPDSWTNKALGSRVLFHVPAEIGWRWDQHNSISFYFEHTSNAWLAKYNEGMDRLGLRYGYRF